MKQLNNWQTIYQDSTVEMTRIKFLDENIGFVLADNPYVIDSLRGRECIFKTIDAGKTWVKYDCLFPTYNDVISNFIPLSSNVSLGIGTSVFKSVDNGCNWVNLYPDHVFGCGAWEIYMKDSLNWELADCSFITQTTDGGKTWTQSFKNDSFPVPVSHISFPSNTVGYASGGASYDYSEFGFIAKTIDGGQNWAFINAEPWRSKNRTFPDANAMQFITEQTGFIFTIHGEIYKTTNGGNNWKLITKLKYTYLGYFLSENIGYCTDENHIYETTDGGKSWNIGYSYSKPTFDVNIMDMYFLKSGEGYAVTRDSKIIKKIN